MDLRKASFARLEKELRPFFELAIEHHPNPIDVQLIRGNPVTAYDYARRILIKARAQGIGKYSGEQIRALKPRIGIFYSKQGITIEARRQRIPAHWDNYRLPFTVLPATEARCTTIAINPSRNEIYSLAELLMRGVLESPIELRTAYTIPDLRDLVGPLGPKLRLFKHGRHTLLWPRRGEGE